MKKAFVAAVVASSLSSCQTLLQGALGINEPQAQHDAAVRNYAAIHYPAYNVYRVDSTGMKPLLRSTYKPGWEPGFRPIQFVCFAPNGTIVAQWASCEGHLKQVLSSFPPRSQSPSDSTKMFHDFARFVRPVSNTNQALKLQPDGYTYLIYWTTWTNRQSINLVKRITDYASRNGGQKSDILLVNVDKYPR